MVEDLEIVVGDVAYLLVGTDHPPPELSTAHEQDTLAHLLVIEAHPDIAISVQDIQQLRTTRLDNDDVFRAEFFRNVVFYGSSQADLDIESDAIELLESWGTETITYVADGSEVPSGPYILLRNKIWQPWRIYHDSYAAFMTTFKPDPHSAGSTLALLDTGYAGHDSRVIVPSRSYFSTSKARPFAGARIAIKDNIDVAGYKTTLCNRAWRDLYPAATEHATCVQKLLDAGAVIIGKVKLQAMITREEPCEAMEYTTPFNPRGDGYQNPTGSSSGSAASIAAYSWLDFTLGSDTNGSGRKPAAVNGCFSIRPSTGLTDNSGIVGYFPEFDMPVFFGRDLSRFPLFIETWYGENLKLRKPPNLPFRLLYPLDYLPMPSEAQNKITEDFVIGLEKALSCSRTAISISETWRKDLPAGDEHSDLYKYMLHAGILLFFYASYHNLKGFREQYQESFGHPPFVHRVVRQMWEDGEAVSKEERDMLWQRSETYGSWLLDKVFNVNSTDYFTVMVLPVGDGQPDYRERDTPGPFTLPGTAPLNLSPIMRAPEITAPIGTIPLNSKVTQRIEPLPVAISLLGPPGSDLLLPHIVKQALRKASIPTIVGTGRFLY